MARSDGMVWAYSKRPISIQKSSRAKIEQRVMAAVEKTVKIKGMMSRMAIRRGRVYLYRLHELPQIEGIEYTVPLIDGKYLEIPLLRITIFDRTSTDCSLDFQRHNDQWMAIDEGTLEECIEKAEVSEWFES
ncbi:MAG: hypothetical protein LBL83_01625 [Clostridiales bacterium]|jgi:hypothetical protein|nr:hypothetical protein [Clostridiales bacterium]